MDLFFAFCMKLSFFPADYEASVTIDSVLEVDDGWMLSGVHQHTLPNIRIVTASMPAAGNYSSFLKAGELHVNS